MAPFGGAGADQGVQLVDEQDDVLVLGDLVHDRLEPLLELAAVLGAGDDGGHVEREHAVVAQHVGAVPVRDQQREAFDDGGLAHARLADQHRIVLLPARQDLHDPLDFLGPADGRVELAFGGELGQVAAEVIQRRRLGLLLRLGGRAGLACRWTRRPGLGHVAAQQPQRLGARLLQVDAGVGQHLRRDALLLAQQAEQQVLGADVGVVQLAGLGHGRARAPSWRARCTAGRGRPPRPPSPSSPSPRSSAGSLRGPRSGSCSTAAATPSPSRMRPSRMCSVPTYSWCRRAASSRAICSTFRTRSVKL